MRSIIRSIAFGFFVGLMCISANSQVQVGSYSFETADSKGFDVINVGNLNVHFNLPIVSKAGRGLPFSYSLGYDSSVWFPYDAGAGPAWTNTQAFGWLGDTATMTGYIEYNTEAEIGFWHGLECWNYTYDAFKYIDPWGRTHVFLGSTTDDSECHGISHSSFTRTANDGSGYTISVTGYTIAVITGRTGTVINAPEDSTSGAGTITDTNGNQISADGLGNFVDTVGSTVLTVAGGAPSNETFTYKDATGTSRTTTVAYQSYTVQTNFGCSGISEFGPTTVYLVHTVTHPDGEVYTFDYEPTPGASSNVTGRLARVTLPTGGRITYSYSGGSNGINCDGSTATLTRTMDDDPAGSTWTYATSTPNGSGTSHTDVVDGLTNHSSYDFVLDNGIPYETQRSMYDGAISGTPTLQRDTCYNAATDPCTTTAITSAITQVDTYNVLNGAVENGVEQIFNSSGLMTEQDDYDYGTSGRGPLLQKTQTIYGSLNLPTNVNVYDGASRPISQTAYAYDVYSIVATSGLPQHVSASSTPGNLSSITSRPNSGAWLQTAAFTYDDAGQVRTSQDAHANTTTYTYDSATDGFLIGVSLPTTGSVTHSISSTYDVDSGMKLTDVDQNGNTTTYSYDSLLRPSSISAPGGAYTSFTFSPGSSIPYVTTSALHVTGGSSITTTSYLDPYGRIKQDVSSDTPSNDLTDYGYDANGRLSSISNPYRSGETVHTASYAYDSLGRLLTTYDSDGTSQVGYSYSANSVTITDEAGNPRQIISDGIGRTSAVWEANPTTGTLALETDYTYDHYDSGSGYFQTIVNQKGGSSSSSDWRTRTITYDMMYRVLSSGIPEAGTTTYNYPMNSSSCAGDESLACSRTDANGTTTTYAYDALNRLTGKTYSGSSIGTATATVAYYYDQASYNGLTVANGIGMRTGMSDGSGNTAWSYDGFGRIGAIRKTINGVTKQASYSYNADGTTNTLQDFSGATFTYGYDAAGRPTNIVDGSSNSYASSATYNAAGQLHTLNHQLTSTSGTYARTLNYNERLQPSSISATWNGSTTIQNLTYGYGTGGTNNGNIMSIANLLDGTRTQSYSYDKLNRLTGGYDTHWGETYTYDNWGNLTATGQITGHAGNNWSVTAGGNNQLSNLSYDSAGEVTLDQFSNSFSYDAEGHNLTGGTGSYVYDGDGNRVAKTVGTTTVLYWPGIDGILDESNSSGSTLGKQVQFAGVRVWSEDTSGAGSFLFHDHLGSVRVTGSASGTIQDDNDYQSFGALYNNYGASPSNNHYLFTGYETDSPVSSSDYAFSRNLSMSMGRFNRPDPNNGSYDDSNPQSLNRYAYVLNNPMIFTDPSGECGKAAPGETSAASWLDCILQALKSLNVLRGLLGGEPDGGGGGGAGDNPFLSMAVGGQNATGGGGGMPYYPPDGGAPPNANMGVVLYTRAPTPTPIRKEGLLDYVMQWNAVRLDSRGRIVPRQDQYGITYYTVKGEIFLWEDQSGSGKHFSDQWSQHGEEVSAADSIGARPPFLQRWTVGGRPVRLVIGGTTDKPQLAWTVKVTVTTHGPVYSKWP